MTSEEILALLNLELPTWCSRAVISYDRNIAKPSKKKIGSYECRSWTCDTCTVKKKFQSGYRIAQLIVEHEQVFVADFETPHWNTIYQRLFYSDANWAKILTTVYSTNPFQSGTLFTTEDAIRELGRTIRVIQRPPNIRKFVPITTSDRWKNPKLPKKWERISWVRSAAHVQQAIDNLGLHPQFRERSPADWLAFWEDPSLWTPEMEQLLIAELTRISTQ